MASKQHGQSPPVVSPREESAFFTIETSNGYVRIDQSVGSHAQYTPEEAREIATEILDAADRAGARTE